MAAHFLRGAMRLATRTLIKPVLGPRVPVPMQRRLLKLAGAATRTPRSVPVRRQGIGGVSGEWLGAPAAGAAPVILYLHGGGYCVGSPASHRPITAQLARITRLAVYAADYRLAPEHPHPAALDDAVAVYRALSAAGHSRIVLAGDSAGAGLALATALSLRDAGVRLPAALVLMSPWVDLGCGGDSMQAQAAQDPMLSLATLQRWAREYVGAMPAEHPHCSPLFGDLRGLPPMLIQVGSDEVLLDDSRRLHAGVQQAGGSVQLQVCEGLWHDFQLQAGVMPEADRALAAIDEFIRGTLSGTA